MTIQQGCNMNKYQRSEFLQQEAGLEDLDDNMYSKVVQTLLPELEENLNNSSGSNAISWAQNKYDSDIFTRVHLGIAARNLANNIERPSMFDVRQEAKRVWNNGHFINLVEEYYLHIQKRMDDLRNLRF